MGHFRNFSSKAIDIFPEGYQVPGTIQNALGNSKESQSTPVGGNIIEIWGLEELTDLHNSIKVTDLQLKSNSLSPLCPINCGNFVFKHMRIEEKHKPIVPDLTGLFGVRHSLVAQSLSRVQLFAIPRTTGCQASLSFTVSQNLLKLISIESMMPSNHLILCFPLLLLPSIFPCLRVFSSELAARIRWLKYWSFSFSTSASSENSGLISFRIDWFDLFAVQGTLKSLLQHHSS